MDGALKLPTGVFREVVKVVVVQINFQLELGAKSTFILADSNKHRRKIMFLLDNIEKLDPHIVIFPEYSISPDYTSELRAAADTTNTVIVGGSYHDTQTLQNVCPIFIPGEPIVYSCKKYLSDAETRYVRSAPHAATEIHWDVYDNTFCMQIFVCSDYLATALYSDVHVDEKLSGIIVVTMSSRDVNSFNALASIHLRYPRGKFVVLCNACGEIISGTLVAVGKSSIWASSAVAESNRPHIDLGNEEGLLVCNLNLASPKLVNVKPTSISASRYQQLPAYGEEKYILIPKDTKFLTY